MARLRVAVTLATAASALVLAGPALAHEHQVCTPGGGDPVLGQEPFHGEDPSGGAILRNPHVTEASLEAWGLHPSHHFLHVGPSAGNRAISVVRTDTASCP